MRWTYQLSTSINNLMTENKKLTSQLMVVSNGNALLVTLVTELQKQHLKMEQYSRRNNVEISGMSNEASDENLDIELKPGIYLRLFDIDKYHRLPSGCINTSNNKQMIVKFVNRKHSEALFHLKKILSAHSNISVTNSLCPYYRFLWGKCKDLQRKG